MMVNNEVGTVQAHTEQGQLAAVAKATWGAISTPTLYRRLGNVP